MRAHLTGLFADAASHRIGLTDIGISAMIGGLLGELVLRLVSLLGYEPAIDGWREGMFFGGLIALFAWVFGELEA